MSLDTEEATEELAEAVVDIVLEHVIEDHDEYQCDELDEHCEDCFYYNINEV